MAKTRREKKSETLEVRMPHSKKQAFKAACEAEGITVSHAVRSFIDAYLKRSRRMKLKQITQEISMTLIRNPLKTTGGLGAVILASLAVFTMTATPGMADPADRDAQPISPPIPSYPMDMADLGLGAKCEAVFDVSIEGYVEAGMKVECSHPGFVEAVRNAVITLRFLPKLVDGKAVRRTGVVYPLEFMLVAD
ncbi:MAG: energy transducer TonB [Henriciella sp.]|nr:energy transducer TonB [Henriciella sp.]